MAGSHLPIRGLIFATGRGGNSFEVNFRFGLKARCGQNTPAGRGILLHLGASGRRQEYGDRLGLATGI